MGKNCLIVVIRYLPTSLVLRDAQMAQLDFSDHPGSVRSDEMEATFMSLLTGPLTPPPAGGTDADG